MRVFLPILILIALGGTSFFLLKNPPEVKKRADEALPAMTVETMKLTPQEYRVMLESYGTVKPRTDSMLVSQVSGKIVSVNPNLREGGFFQKGDVLLNIEADDYVVDVDIAKAALLNAEQMLIEEEARAEQALKDWQRMQRKGEPSDLLLRKPQMLAAEANVQSAKASLKKARLNLQRTKIIAPFDGRVLSQMVDMGQVVSANTQLADVYASDVVEIRLPIRNRDLGFIHLPEPSQALNEKKEKPVVRFKSELGVGQTWLGEVVRTESAIDETARQLHVVAQITNPYEMENGNTVALKIGQYVQAEIAGNVLSNVIVIPNSAIYQGSYVYVVEDNMLQHKDINIAWQNDYEALITSGLEQGDELVLTPLGQVTSGIKVNVAQKDKDVVKPVSPIGS